MVLTFLKTYVDAHNPFDKFSEIEKCTSHNITHLTLFTHIFCHTHVQNLLKAPDVEGLVKNEQRFMRLSVCAWL